MRWHEQLSEPGAGAAVATAFVYTFRGVVLPRAHDNTPRRMMMMGRCRHVRRVLDEVIVKGAHACACADEAPVDGPVAGLEDLFPPEPMESALAFAAGDSIRVTFECMVGWAIGAAAVPGTLVPIPRGQGGCMSSAPLGECRKILALCRTS